MNKLLTYLLCFLLKPVEVRFILPYVYCVYELLLVGIIMTAIIVVATIVL